MDASTAAASSASATFGGIDPKLDLTALLKNVAAAAAASSVVMANSVAATASGANTALTMPLTGSTATSPNSVESSISTNGLATTSPSPPDPSIAASVADMKPISAASLAPPGVYQRRQLPFTPIKPSYAPSGHGRQILVYDSRSHPGRRREFAYKTRFTNQSGLTTVYYRCMACRALRHRLQRVLPKEKLPALQVPCIAVKNDLLINDPDFPDASDHFCSPLTIDESNQRLQNTFERGHKRARMKMANSAVEETIRKVGRLNAEVEIKTEEENGGGGREEEESCGTLSIDLWTKAADASTTMDSSGLDEEEGQVEQHREGSSDCSSDSLVVDVLKEESTDEELVERLRRDQLSLKSAQLKSRVKEENAKFASECSSRAHHPQPLQQPSSSLSSRPKAAASQRSPRKKLDTLLLLAELRAKASANGGNDEGTKGENVGGHVEGAGAPQRAQALVGTAQQHSSHHPSSASSVSNCSTSSSASCRSHPGNANGLAPNSVPLHFNGSLGSFFAGCSAPSPFPTPLSVPNIGQHFHHQQHSNGHPPPLPASPSLFNSDTVQSIQAIASRLSRGVAMGSELSKALGSNNKTVQKAMNPLNGGGENLAGNGNGYAGMAKMQQQMKGALLNGSGEGQQLMVAELLKKYAENNLEMSTPVENVNINNPTSRNAGELACAMFMAQMVENAELRQEVQKLRAELDSLKTLVSAIVGGGNNGGGVFENGGGGGGTNGNGHLRHQFHH